MDNAQKRQIELEVLKELEMFFKLNGESYTAQSPQIKKLIVMGFQTGIGYWNKKSSEQKAQMRIPKEELI